MTVRTGWKPAIGALLVAIAAAGTSACDMSLGGLSAKATDEWTRTYSLTPGGEIRIVNGNGRVDVEPADGAQIEVRAERIARGATEAAARELLPKITINEDVKPDRVTLETARMTGLLIGVSFEVRYHVRAPKTAVVNVNNTNGQIVVTGLAGRVLAHTTNGSVRGSGLSGGVDASTTNGSVNVDFAAIGSDPITMHTTNGSVTVGLPDTAKATISASWTNGGINIAPELKVESAERSRRRFDGMLNGGGTSIDVHTTNGGIRIRRRGEATESGEHGDK